MTEPDRSTDPGMQAPDTPNPDIGALRERDGRFAAWLRSAFTSPLKRHIYRVVVICLVSMLLHKIDLVGSQSASDAMAHDFVMQLGNQVGLWPEHDPLRHHEVTQAQVAETWRRDRPDGVTLVLWTDRAMRTLREEGIADVIWPINYLAHAEALYNARRLGAKTIFLDFVFPTKRDDSTWAELQKELYDFAESETSLFIACDHESPDPAAFPEFLETVRAVNKKADRTVISFVPAALPREPVIRSYDLWVEFKAGRSSENADCGAAHALASAGGTQQASMTVAPALYEDAQNRANGWVTRDTPKMSIFWDRRVHPATRAVFDTDKPEPICTFDLILEWIEAILFDMSAVARYRSGPPIMPADLLVFPYEPEPGRHTLSTQDMIDGRVVIIGSAQTSAADFRNTPNAPARPGALVHAVALENLFRFGTDYVRERPYGVVPKLSDLVLFVTIVVTSLVYSLILESKIWSRDPRQFVEATKLPAWTRFKWSLLIGAVAALASSLWLLNQRLPPSNWFTTLMAFSFLSAPVLLQAISAWLSNRMYHLDEHKE